MGTHLPLSQLLSSSPAQRPVGAGWLRYLRSANSQLSNPPLPKDAVTYLLQSRVNRESFPMDLFVLPAWKEREHEIFPAAGSCSPRGNTLPRSRAPPLPFHRSRADGGQRQPRVFIGNSLELRAIVFVVLPFYFLFLILCCQ